MSRDHIVDEVRRVRAEIAAKYDNDLDAIFAAARKAQAKSGRKVALVRGKSGHPVKTGKPKVAKRNRGRQTSTQK